MAVVSGLSRADLPMRPAPHTSFHSHLHQHQEVAKLVQYAILKGMHPTVGPMAVRRPSMPPVAAPAVGPPTPASRRPRRQPPRQSFPTTVHEVVPKRSAVEENAVVRARERVAERKQVDRAHSLRRAAGLEAHVPAINLRRAPPYSTLHPIPVVKVGDQPRHAPERHVAAKRNPPHRLRIPPRQPPASLVGFGTALAPTPFSRGSWLQIPAYAQSTSAPTVSALKSTRTADLSRPTGRTPRGGDRMPSDLGPGAYESHRVPGPLDAYPSAAFANSEVERLWASRSAAVDDLDLTFKADPALGGADRPNSSPGAHSGFARSTASWSRRVRPAFHASARQRLIAQRAGLAEFPTPVAIQRLRRAQQLARSTPSLKGRAARLADMEASSARRTAELLAEFQAG